jgi:hypothetical protein
MGRKNLGTRLIGSTTILPYHFIISSPNPTPLHYTQRQQHTSPSALAAAAACLTRTPVALLLPAVALLAARGVLPLPLLLPAARRDAPLSSWAAAGAGAAAGVGATSLLAAVAFFLLLLLRSRTGLLPEALTALLPTLATAAAAAAVPSLGRAGGRRRWPAAAEAGAGGVASTADERGSWADDCAWSAAVLLLRMLPVLGVLV